MHVPEIPKKPSMRSGHDSSEDRNQKRANLAWFRLSEIYGERWFATNGESAPFMWVMRLSELSNDQIARGLDRLSQKVDEKGRSFMPNLPEFVEACTYLHPVDAARQLPAPDYSIREAQRSAMSVGWTREEVEGKDHAELHQMYLARRFGKTA